MDETLRYLFLTLIAAYNDQDSKLNTLISLVQRVPSSIDPNSKPISIRPTSSLFTPGAAGSNYIKNVNAFNPRLINRPNN